MRIVVNTPTGNIGRVVVKRLLEAKHNVVVISRHPEKVAAATANGVTLVRGSIDEDAVVERALEGAGALFWLTPIAFEPVDYMAWAKDIAQRAASAARRCHVRRAVVVSSIGAQHNSGVGPIGCNPFIERAFTTAVPNVTVLRPGSFMENLLQHVGTIAQAGTMYTRYPISMKIPWIATRDIAESAVRGLTDERSTGAQMLELQGPEDLDQLQVGSILSEGIGRPVTAVEVTDEQAKHGMVGAGMPSAFADLLLEMYSALACGRMRRTQARSAVTSTPTTLLTFARQVIKPAVEAALAR
ncbi:MAG: NAD(P)H-binding protein [Polyangiaceae bacterium]|jgi:uncharacterized protein YbjT (DUF2867 family)